MMPIGGAIFMAVVVGMVSFMVGATTIIVAVYVAKWFGNRDADFYERPIDQAAQEAQARIARVHRRAHEMLATTVLQEAGEEAEFDGLLRTASKSSNPGARP